MKYILFAALSCLGMAAHANENCSGNVSDAYKYQSLTAQVDVFGTWVGVNNGEPFVAVFTKTAGGNYSGTLTLGTKQVGPTGVQICDYGKTYSLIVFFQEAGLRVISSKKVEITLPFSGNPKVIVTKQ